VAAGLLEEARLLARVRHTNVVSLLGVEKEEASGVPFLVLELVSGSDLCALSRGYEGAGSGPGSMSWQLAVHVACALLRALGAVQRALPGLVHRDVTPHNVLVSTEGEVKLADFGIALTRERASRPSPAAVCGKIGYMAPEQMRGERLDVRTDLFAVGVVLHELLTGRRPAERPRASRGSHAAERGLREPLARLRPDLSRNLIDVVDRLLAPLPADRYAGPDEALRDLALHGAGELGSLRMAGLVRARGCSRAPEAANPARWARSPATSAARTREEPRAPDGAAADARSDGATRALGRRPP
jgi:serine/threonine-protein kinase